MSTLIVKNFRSELDKVVLDKSLIPNFWILDPENDVANLKTQKGFIKNMLRDSSIKYDLENDRYAKYTAKKGFEKTESLPEFVFYPYFDDQGYSHLIYSENENNESITIYFEPSRKEGKAKEIEDQEIRAKVKAFQEGFKRNWLNRFNNINIRVKQKEDSFDDFEDNGPDPNYATLLNFIFEKVGQTLQLEPLFEVMTEAFRSHYGEHFKIRDTYTLTLYNPEFKLPPGRLSPEQKRQVMDPFFDDLSNVLGETLLTDVVMKSFYRLIPNSSNIPLLGTEGNDMFRLDSESADRAEARTLLETYTKNSKGETLFLLSNPNKNHWVLFVISKEPQLKFTIYDSLPRTDFSWYFDPDELVRQMNVVFKPKKAFTLKDMFMAKLKTEEKQKDLFNCGVFSLLQMQKILNNTSIFNVLEQEGKGNTIQVTPASYRMNILSTLWQNGLWVKEAERNRAPTLPKLFTNLYGSMHGQIHDLKRKKDEAAKLYQTMLMEEDPKNKFQLSELYDAFTKKFKVNKDSDLSQIENQNKVAIQTLTDELTLKLSDIDKKRLSLALLSMQNKFNEVVSNIKERVDSKFSLKEMKKLLPVNPLMVDILYCLKLDPNKTHSIALTQEWLSQFGAKDRKAIYDALILGKSRVTNDVSDDDDDEKEKRAAEEAEKVAKAAEEAEEAEKSKSKENEEEEEDVVLIAIQQKLIELSEIASKKKYKCERECILRISDKLFREFASNVEKLKTEKMKTFSIYEILTGPSSTFVEDLDESEKIALVPTLARVISILE